MSEKESESSQCLSASGFISENPSQALSISASTDLATPATPGTPATPESQRQRRRELWFKSEMGTIISETAPKNVSVVSDNAASMILDLCLDEQYLQSGFKVGVAEDKNKRYRRSMEDTHVFIYDYNEQVGSGFFGIFDGHAGKAAADWCGQKVHEVCLISFILTLIASI